MRAGFHAGEATFALFRAIDAGMFVKEIVYLADNLFGARVDALPAGFA